MHQNLLSLIPASGYDLLVYNISSGNCFSCTISKNQPIHPAVCRNQFFSQLNDVVPFFLFLQWIPHEANFITQQIYFVTRKCYLTLRIFYDSQNHPEFGVFSRTHFHWAIDQRVWMVIHTFASQVPDTDVSAVKSSASYHIIGVTHNTSMISSAIMTKIHRSI